MKIIVYTIAVVLVAAFGLVGWSIAGRLMTTGGDMGMLQGLAILGGLVGLAGALAAVGAKKVLSYIEENAPASIDSRSDSKKESCR